MRAFIVRPFGKKQEIDFDLVQRTLIDPALASANITALIDPALASANTTGNTAAEVLEAGNIRADMFRPLLLADVVIADVSIDNANVFYELGVRHALRAKRTILIRARGVPIVPFDLRTDRYLEYDSSNPAQSLTQLQQALRQTVASDRVDSPVFLLLPELRELDGSGLMPIPREFLEEVGQAKANRQVGRLRLLEWEAQGFTWESAGSRTTGRALFELSAWESARAVWERVRSVDPVDVEANLLLGTIYQRLADLTASDLAVRRVLANTASKPMDRAEAVALLARNDKVRLTDAWSSGNTIERQQKGLRSPYLLKSYQNYRRGFLFDLNHFYSGLNALALVSITLELIRQQRSLWSERFDTDEEAETQRKALEKECAELANSTGLSLEAARERLPEGTRDIWLDISIADHKFLTAERPAKAADAYRQALAGSSSFHMTSARAQLLLYRSLGIFEEQVTACLAEFPQDVTQDKTANAPRFRRAIVFTGHMIDAPDRPKPRFPNDRAPVAAAAIDKKLSEIAGADAAASIGFAGGASGGDLLFHEACARQRIVSRMRLALPVRQFMARSVDPADSDWPKRFNDAADRLRDTLEILGSSEDLPPWLTRKQDYNVWGRTNVWLLEEALASGASDVHLLALWNGEKGDGPGGTAHLIEVARQQSVSIHILDTKALFGL